MRRLKIPTPIPPREITRRGLDKSCRVCSDTLDLWTAIYGAEAGNLALKSPRAKVASTSPEA